MTTCSHRPSTDRDQQALSRNPAGTGEVFVGGRGYSSRRRAELLSKRPVGVSVRAGGSARSIDHPWRAGAQPARRQPRPAPRRDDRVHRAVRVGQVEPRLRHDLRRGPAPLRGVAVLLRAAVPRPDGQARRRLHRGPAARPSRSTRSRPRATRARPSARSPRSTTTCACCSPGSASRTARSAARRSPGRRRSRSSTGCWPWTTAPGSRCSRRWSAAARASTSTCSPSCSPRASPGPGSTATVHPLTEPPKLKKQEKHTIEVVVDRLAVKATRQAAADRLGRDRAEARRRHRDARVRRPARGRRAPGAEVLRAPGLPQRPPAGDRGPGAAVVLVQRARTAPARSAPAWAPRRRSTRS